MTRYVETIQTAPKQVNNPNDEWSADEAEMPGFLVLLSSQQKAGCKLGPLNGSSIL